MEQELEPAYFAVIPATVRYDTAVPANAKLLYGEITALCNKKGFCWASNQHFAKLYNVHKDTVSDWVTKLVQRGYIRAIPDPMSPNVRRIYLAEALPKGIGENAYGVGKNADSNHRRKRLPLSVKTPTPIGENAEGSRQKRLHNNKDNNTGNNKGNNKENLAVANAPVSGKNLSVDLEEKKKKKAPRSAAPPPPDAPIVTKIRAMIETKTPGYYWKGTDGNAAKEIAAKLQAAIVGNRPQAANEPDLDDKVLNALSVMIDRTAELKSYYHYSDLPNLNKKYNEIFTLLKSASKPGASQQNGRTVAPAHRTATERASNLNSMFNDIDRAFGE